MWAEGRYSCLSLLADLTSASRLDTWFVHAHVGDRVREPLVIATINLAQLAHVLLLRLYLSSIQLPLTQHLSMGPILVALVHCLVC
jgi:hypothetical protein